MYSSYEDAYQNALNNITPIEELVEEKGVADKLYMKAFENARTLEEKDIIRKEKELTKSLDISSYRTGFLNLFKQPDYDSGRMRDGQTGQLLDFRMKTSNLNDGVDELKAVLKSFYKSSTQPEFVKKITGKDVITEEDYKNVKNYQFNEFVRALTEKDYVFEKYDRNRNAGSENPYTRIDTSKLGEIEVAYKVLGTDMYGRNIVDIVNPKTGRSLAFDIAQNPYLNASFNTYEMMGTEKNQRRQDIFDKLASVEPVFKNTKNLKANATELKNIVNTAKEQANSPTTISDNWSLQAIDTFMAANAKMMLGPLGENIHETASIAYASALRLGANLLSVVPWADQDKWKALSKKAASGVLDAQAGVSPETRLDYQKKMQEAGNLFDSSVDAWQAKKYTKSTLDMAKAIGTYASQLNRIIAESAPQMIAGLVAGGVAAGTATVTGGASIAGTVSLVGSALTIAADETITTMHDFEDNNNGRSMEPDDVAKLFAWECLAAAPEAVFSKVGLGKILPTKGIGKYLGFSKNDLTVSLLSKNPSFAKYVGASAVTEFFQEPTQQSLNTYFSQNQDPSKKKAYADVLFSRDSGKAAVIGALAGGTTASLIGSYSHIKRARANAKFKEHLDIVTHNANNQTVADFNPDATTKQAQSANLDVEASKSAFQLINTIAQQLKSNPESITLEQAAKQVEEINNQLTNQNISFGAARNLALVKAQLQATAIRNASTQQEVQQILNENGTTAEDFFRQAVYHSNWNAQELASRGLEAVDPQAEKTKLEELGKKLGLSDKVIERRLDTKRVANDVAYGPQGYNTYADALGVISKRLRNESATLTDVEKADLRHSQAQLLDKLLYLQASQATKIYRVQKGLEQLTKTNKDTQVSLGDWKFNIIASHLIRYDLNGENSIFGVLKDMTKSVQEISKILETYSKEQAEAVQDARAAFNPSLQSQVNPNNVKALTGIINDIKRLVLDYKAKGKADTHASENERNSGSAPTYSIREYFSKLMHYNDNKDTDKAKLAAVTTSHNILSEMTPEQVKELTDYINSKLEHNPKRRDAFLNTLAEIHEERNSTNKATDELNKERENMNAKVKPILDEVTPEAIKSVTDATKLLEMYGKLYKAIDTAFGDTKEEVIKRMGLVMERHRELQQEQEQREQDRINNQNNQNNENNEEENNEENNEEEKEDSKEENKEENNEENKEEETKEEEENKEENQEEKKEESKEEKKDESKEDNKEEQDKNSKEENQEENKKSEESKEESKEEDKKESKGKTKGKKKGKKESKKTKKSKKDKESSESKEESHPLGVTTTSTENAQVVRITTESNETFEVTVGHDFEAILEDFYAQEADLYSKIAPAYRGLYIHLCDADAGTAKKALKDYTVAQINKFLKYLTTKTNNPITLFTAYMTASHLLTIDAIDDTYQLHLTDLKKLDSEKTQKYFNQLFNQAFNAGLASLVLTVQNDPNQDESSSNQSNQDNQTGQKASESTSEESSKKSDTNTQDNSKKPSESKSDGSVNIWYGSNENSELSNLAERPFIYYGKQYRSVEHAYQTLKSGQFDADTYAKYQNAKEGSKITGRPANTKDDANIKLMKALMLASFQQNEQARQALLDTGNKTLTHTQEKSMWGKVFPQLLTEIRDELRTSEEKSASNTDIHEKFKATPHEIGKADEVIVVGDLAAVFKDKSLVDVIKNPFRILTVFNQHTAKINGKTYPIGWYTWNEQSKEFVEDPLFPEYVEGKSAGTTNATLNDFGRQAIKDVVNFSFSKNRKSDNNESQQSSDTSQEQAEDIKAGTFNLDTGSKSSLNISIEYTGTNQLIDTVSKEIHGTLFYDIDKKFKSLFLYVFDETGRYTDEEKISRIRSYSKNVFAAFLQHLQSKGAHPLTVFNGYQRLLDMLLDSPKNDLVLADLRDLNSKATQDKLQVFAKEAKRVGLPSLNLTITPANVTNTNTNTNTNEKTDETNKPAEDSTKIEIEQKTGIITNAINKVRESLHNFRNSKVSEATVTTLNNYITRLKERIEETKDKVSGFLIRDAEKNLEDLEKIKESMLKVLGKSEWFQTLHEILGSKNSLTAYEAAYENAILNNTVNFDTEFTKKARNSPVYKLMENINNRGLVLDKALKELLGDKTIEALKQNGIVTFTEDGIAISNLNRLFKANKWDGTSETQLEALKQAITNLDNAETIDGLIADELTNLKKKPESYKAKLAQFLSENIERVNNKFKDNFISTLEGLIESYTDERLADIKMNQKSSNSLLKAQTKLNFLIDHFTKQGIDTENSIDSELLAKAKDTLGRINEAKAAVDNKVDNAPSTKLLNGRINRSVNIGQGDTVNLNNELVCDLTRATSQIALDDSIYTEDQVTSIRNTFNKIKLTLEKLGKSFTPNKHGGFDPIRSPLKYLQHMLKNRGHAASRLLYNIDVVRGTIEFNDTVLKAIDFSIRQYLDNIDFLDKFNSSADKKDLCRLFGLNDETLTFEETSQLRQFVRENGIPRAVMTDTIGRMILQNLGIYANRDTATRGFYESLQSGLGAYALEYLQAKGLVNLNTWNKDQWSKNNPDADGNPGEHVLFAKQIHCIKLQPKSKKALIELAESYRNHYKAFALDTFESSQPRWSTRPDVLSAQYLRNTDNMVEMPQTARGLFNALQNMTFDVDEELVDFILANKANISDRLGMTADTEIDYLTYDQAASAAGVNSSIERTFSDLETFMEEVRRRKELDETDANHYNGIYFDWFMSRNGRFFIDSVGLNPQTNKLHRFVCMPRSVFRDFDPNNAEHIEAENFAIAQAFNVLDTDENTTAIAEKIKALSLEQIHSLREALVQKNEKEFETWTNDTFGFELGIENLTQCLNVTQHLIRRKENNGQVFKTWLAVENDATTSGFAIRFLQMPLEEMAQYFHKVGLLTDTEGDINSTIHALKKSDFNNQAFLDIYKTFAALSSQHLSAINLSKAFNEKKMPLQYSERSAMYEALKPLLPKVEEGKVSKELRALLKPAVMVFGYTAGLKSIAEKLTEELTTNMINAFVKYEVASSRNEVFGFEDFVKKNPQFKYTAEQMEHAWNFMLKIKSLYDAHPDVIKKKGTKDYVPFVRALQTKSLSQIFLRVVNDNSQSQDKRSNTNLAKYLVDLIQPTYGQSIYSALSESFSEYAKINQCMNDMAKANFTLFHNAYTVELNHLNRKYNNNVPLTEYKAMIQRLSPLLPTVQLMFGENPEDGQMLLMKTKKSMDDANEGRTITFNNIATKDGTISQLKQDAVYGALRDFTNAGQAGAVIPIHFIDGMVMLHTLAANLDEGIIPVHDALVMSAMSNAKVSQTMNMRLMQICQSYDVYNNMFDRTLETVKNYIEWRQQQLAAEMDKEYALNEKISAILNTPVNEIVIGKESGEGRTVYTTDQYLQILGNEEEKLYPSIVEQYFNADVFSRESIVQAVAKGNFDTQTGQLEDIQDKFKENVGDKQNITPYSIMHMLANALRSSDQILAARKSFYEAGKTYYCMNVDGSIGSAAKYTVSNDTEEVLAQYATELIRDHLQKQGSDPNAYTSVSFGKQLLLEAKANVEARLQLMDALDGVDSQNGNRITDPAHMKKLKSIIRLLDPAKITNIRVELHESLDNAGLFDHKSIQLFQNKTNDQNWMQQHGQTNAGLATKTNMSLAEIFAHETIHAGLDFAFARNLEHKAFSKEIGLLVKLWNEAAEIVPWETFLPDNFSSLDTKAQALYTDYAKKTWDYIFTDNGKGHLSGLKEFCAYGLTHPKVVELLQSNKAVTRFDKKLGLLDRLVLIVKRLFDTIFGSSHDRFRDLFPYIFNVLRNKDSAQKASSFYDELTTLAQTLSNIDNQANESLVAQSMRPIELAMSFLGKYVGKANKGLSGIIKYIINYGDNHNWNAPNLTRARRITANPIDMVKLFGEVVAKFAFSGRARQVWKRLFENLSYMSYQSMAQSIFRDMSILDWDSHVLEMHAMGTRMVDRIAECQRSATYQNLLSAFGLENGKKLSVLEEQSLTKTCLMTDIQCLFESMTFDEVKTLLTDKNALEAKIKAYEDSLIKTKNGMWFVNQAESLAYYMTTGIGHEALNLNAHNIAIGLNSGMTKAFTEPSQALVNQIDQLATLYALRNTDEDAKTIVNTLKAEGVKNFIDNHRQFVRESRDGLQITDQNGKVQTVQLLDNRHLAKGYIKQVFDTSYDFKVDFVDKAKQLKEEGYSIVRVYNPNQVTGLGNEYTVALYRRSFAPTQRRDGAAFMLQGAHAMGTTLSQTTGNFLDFTQDKNVPNNSITGTYRDIFRKFRDRADTIRRTIARNMMTKRMSPAEIAKQSTGYIPVVSPNKNVPTDYRITMSHANKIQDLKLNMNGLTILSKMYGQQYTKSQIDSRNAILLEFLRKVAREHGIDRTKTRASVNSLEGHDELSISTVPYIRIEEHSTNKFMADAWYTLPDKIKHVAKNEELYVREDWLLDLFGTPNVSIADNATVQKFTSVRVRMVISAIEYFLKFTATVVKKQIVNLIPAVLIGNIMANFAWSVMQGHNPLKVARMQIANARNIRKYLTTEKELNRINHKIRIGTATEAERKSVSRLQVMLDRNPISELVRKGFYQSIIEDLNTNEQEAIGVVQKYLTQNKVTDKMPKWMKWLGKQLYFLEGTPFYDFMFTATQYSDFVARATEYQLAMNKFKGQKFTRDGKKTIAFARYEADVFRQLLNVFINYDRPQSSKEQYLNDIGLTMFTKFAKRIQPIVTGQFIHNPLGVLATMAFQYCVYDVESIVEQNVFMKHWLSLFHNPATNLWLTLVPFPIQGITGVGHFSKD